MIRNIYLEFEVDTLRNESNINKRIFYCSEIWTECRTKALPDKSPPIKKWQGRQKPSHDNEFVRPVIFTGGLLFALSFSWEGFCPPCHFHGRAFVREGFCPFPIWTWTLAL
jgi:hypothetical protein